jgi:ribA/ribD-fused uncharacterized protein
MVGRMRITDTYVFFWSGIYSNWYPSIFTYATMKFNCGEQYMMWNKAFLFQDKPMMQKIMETEEPKEQKASGRKVKGFDPAIWDLHCREIMVKGLYNKFIQNPELKAQMLIDGKGRCFVEASPYDAVWGVGLGENDYRINDPAEWQGKNYLGQVLNSVYNILVTEL